MTEHTVPVYPQRGVPLTQRPHATIAPVYVWEFPVRLSHWLIVLSVMVLSVTGFYIGRPWVNSVPENPAGFATGYFRAVHFYAATAFVGAVFMRMYWTLVSRNRFASWMQFIPITRRRWTKLGQVLRFYLFLSDQPPMTVGHNPLAGVTYFFVFLLYHVMILTGWGLYGQMAALSSPLHFLGFLAPVFGGLQMCRYIHHIGMWLLLGFFVHHVASALLVSRIEKNGLMDSIFSGWKYLNVNEYYQDQKGQH